MTAARPHRAKPRQAPPVPRARRQLSQRPRRWGRPLAVGLALVLVAALVPGAAADPDDGGGMPAAAETFGDQAAAETDLQTLEAKAMAETLEAPTSAAAPEGADGNGGDGSGDRVALADGGEATGGGGLPAARPQPDPVPLEVAQQPQEGQPAGVQQPEPEVATDQPLDQAEQDLLARLDAGQECGADGCQEGPGLPPIIRGDTHGGTGQPGPGGRPAAGGPTGQPPDQPGLTLERLQQLRREQDSARRQFRAERDQAEAALQARHDQERIDLAAEWDQRIATATEDLRPAQQRALAMLYANQLQERVQVREIMAMQQQSAWRAAWLPPAEEPVLVEQDSTSATVFRQQLAAFRPDWQRAQDAGTPLSADQVAQQLGVHVATARDYLRYLQFEQGLGPIVAERTVSRRELLGNEELRQEVGIKNNLDKSMAEKVLGDLNHKKVMAAAGVQPSGRSALSDALGIIQPIYDLVERRGGELLPPGLVADLVGVNPTIVGQALHLLRLRDSRIYGTPLSGGETELSRTVRAVEPHFRQQEEEAPGGQELDPSALAKELRQPTWATRAALGLLRSERQPGSQQGQSQMSIVDPKDVNVTGPPGHRPPPTLPELTGFGGDQPVVPLNLPGFRPPPTLPELTGFGGDQYKIPNQTVITATELGNRPLLQQDAAQEPSATWQAITTDPRILGSLGLAWWAIVRAFNSRGGPKPPSAAPRPVFVGGGFGGGSIGGLDRLNPATQLLQ
jgi:hypothetical protein